MKKINLDQAMLERIISTKRLQKKLELPKLTYQY